MNIVAFHLESGKQPPIQDTLGGVRLDYGYGRVVELTYGDNVHYQQAVEQIVLGDINTTGKSPKITYFDPKAKSIADITDSLVKVGSNGAVGMSIFAGFLDRYIVTLAANIHAHKIFLDKLSEISKRCVEQLAEASANVIDLGQAISHIKELIKDSSLSDKVAYQARLQILIEELALAKSKSAGLDVCANFVSYFTKLSEPMEQAYNAMKGQDFLTKLRVFCTTLPDTHSLSGAWKDYSLAEQSLSFLASVSASVGVGILVRDAGATISRHICNADDSKARAIGNLLGIASAVYVATYGTGLLQAAGIGLCAVASKYAAKVVGLGIRTLWG